MGKLPAELEQVPAYHLAEWAGFERVFGPLTVQERIDWAAAEVVSAFIGEKQIDKALLRWDDRPEFDAEAAEAANAMKLEAMLQGAMREGDGNRI